MTVETLEAPNDASARSLSLAKFEEVVGATHFELWSQGKRVITHVRPRTASAVRAMN